MEGLAPPPNRLLELRAERDVTLQDIARACGVYTSTVKYWQTHDIPRHHLPTVARVLRVSVPYLEGWTDDDSGPDPAPLGEAA